MKVQVTQEDINKGNRCDPWNCPLALAMQRATGDRNISVGAATAGPLGKLGMFWLPLEATRFIHDFDFEHPVEPFEFEVEAHG
jgi:hypothetical protein